MSTNTSPIELLIGIDDTDNLESRGTGYHARSIGAAMAENGWGQCRVITRHQLLFSPLVPFTSHNSAACIKVQTTTEHVDDIERFCIRYLQNESAEGSDPGLCIANQQQVTLDLIRFSFLCKTRVVTQQQAYEIAKSAGLKLHGLGGDFQGIIGALASVGLNGSGSDGRLLWLEGMRERAEQIATVGELLHETGIDRLQTVTGGIIEDHKQKIDMGSWPRAIWIGGEATLIIDNTMENSDVWQVAAKEYLRQY
jgi:hypothetical protein